jgi:hypothetical protein
MTASFGPVKKSGASALSSLAYLLVFTGPLPVITGPAHPKSAAADLAVVRRDPVIPIYWAGRYLPKRDCRVKPGDDM